MREVTVRVLQDPRTFQTGTGSDNKQICKYCGKLHSCRRYT